MLLGTGEVRMRKREYFTFHGSSEKEMNIYGKESMHSNDLHAELGKAARRSFNLFSP